MMANVAQLPIDAPENPWLKSRRLMRELAHCLDTMEAD